MKKLFATTAVILALSLAAQLEAAAEQSGGQQ